MFRKENTFLSVILRLGLTVHCTVNRVSVYMAAAGRLDSRSSCQCQTHVLIAAEAIDSDKSRSLGREGAHARLGHGAVGCQCKPESPLNISCCTAPLTRDPGKLRGPVGVTRGSWAVLWMINPTEEPLEVTVVLAVGVPAVYQRAASRSGQVYYSAEV